MTEKYEGEVKWFDSAKGYGFINPVLTTEEVDDTVEYFVHFTSIEMDGFKTLQAKQRVLFNLKETEKGMQAINISFYD